MNRIAMMEEIPEREARAFDTDDGRTILPTTMSAHTCRLNLNFWKISSLTVMVNTSSVQLTERCSMWSQVNAFQVPASVNLLKRLK